MGMTSPVLGFEETDSRLQIAARKYARFVSFLEIDVFEWYRSGTHFRKSIFGVGMTHIPRLQYPCKLLKIRNMVEAAGVEPASENITGQEPTYLFAFRLPG